MKSKKNKVVENPAYRLYSLTNMYLSSIQKGIQTAHVVASMASGESGKNPDFNTWATTDRTIIVLNGGNSKSLFDFVCVLDEYAEKYAWDMFHEDHDSLNGALTAVGIVLPRKVYEGKSKNKADKAIYSYIKDLPLAV